MKLAQTQVKFEFYQDAFHENCLYVQVKSAFDVLKVTLEQRKFQEKIITTF